MVCLVLAMTGCHLGAAEEQPVVEIFLPNLLDRHVSRALGRARGIVDEAYADIGVRVIWRVGKTPPLACEKQPGRRQIVFDFLDGVVKGPTSEALAFANPYQQRGPCVTLLMDRLKNEVERNPETTGLLLGHVLAHEIAHVLQGIARHSETGILKARWSKQEIEGMWRARLHFTAYDAELICEPLRASFSSSPGERSDAR